MQDSDDIKKLASRGEPRLQAGSCVLRNPIAADIVQKAIRFFDGQRYALHGWCVMGNHVHVVLAPLAGQELSSILHSWKSYTANAINRELGRYGEVWERESFDHLIRRAEHVDGFVAYAEDNPVEAGLCAAAGDWPWSSAGVKYERTFKEFVDPLETAFVSPRGGGNLPHLEKPGGTYFVTFRLRDAVTRPC